MNHPRPASRWRAWLAASAILVLGIAIGAAGTAAYGLRTLRSNLLTGAPAAGKSALDRAADRIAADLVANLKLDAAEETRVRAELDQAVENLRTIRTETGKQLVAELRLAARRIAAGLPPPKRTEFYARLEKRLQRLGVDGQRLGVPEASPAEALPANRREP